MKMKWYVTLTASKGQHWTNFLLGGVKRTIGGPFTTNHEAQMFLIASIETNQKAGRILDLEQCEVFEKRSTVS